jgi:excisionase family DNA binding protein
MSSRALRQEPSNADYDLVVKEDMVLQRNLPVEKLLLTLPEVGRVLAISRSKLYDLLNSGNLPSFYIGKSRRVRISDVQAFVNGGGHSEVVPFCMVNRAIES